MSVDLFPTDALLRALDEPGSLLDDLDAAGRRAAAAFDTEAGPTPDKVRAYREALVADPFVPRATRKLLSTKMPRAWDAITLHSRRGQLASVVAQLESEALAGSGRGAAPRTHPVLAYIDEVGVEAARRAFDAYRAALPFEAAASAPQTLLGAATFAGATRAGTDRFIEALGERTAGDIFSFLGRELPSPVFWATVIASAAGALGVLIVAPKLAADAATGLGLELPSFDDDVDVARFGDGVKLRFGGEVRVVPAGLGDGPLWQQALDTAFGGEARVALRFHDSVDLAAGVSWAPEDREWGVKLTFSLLRF